MKNFEKYKKFIPEKMNDRKWPDAVINEVPTWCSVDLRDGNQALINPMSAEDKLKFFNMLCEIGFKEIEVGFPSSSEIEYTFIRRLIDEHLIPDDVAIQVLVQAREHLIKDTFKCIEGAKNVIVHFYNSTSIVQREKVFKEDKKGIIKIAVKAAKDIKAATTKLLKKFPDTNIKFEYSPESFSGTEVDFAVDVCEAVYEELKPVLTAPLIVNLPNTVELATPNNYADQVEKFSKLYRYIDNSIISIHPHNDRGTGTASAELALLAGAKRIEGTLFGNGERTGNVDLVTLALNMYTQGLDPKLDFSNIVEIKNKYEETTNMRVHERHPYAGELAFTAFSGSHQDAIKKALKYNEDHKCGMWEVPYLPIDPKDVGREYEPIIRINSQSGKGGAAFVMYNSFGYDLPKKMQAEFGALVQAKCESAERELTQDEVFEIFESEYLKVKSPYKLLSYSFREEAVRVEGDTDHDYQTVSYFSGKVQRGDEVIDLEQKGNGPINAFCLALNTIGLEKYKFISYQEHAISVGSDAKAVAYIEIEDPDGNRVFGVGIGTNINAASARGILCAVNRAMK